MSFKNDVLIATLPRTTRGQPIVINGDPKGENFLYTNGNNVVIRNIENPNICDVYTEHAVPTTVAKYSPSRFYIASADISGKVRIWDTTSSEHVLKTEIHAISGAIKDIDWSPDSQTIVVAGEGREKFGKVFMWDTGNNKGEVTGHSKAINNVAYKPTRPFKIVTSSEDATVVFHEGPPFKFKTSIQEHQKFVNCVRYSPNGDYFITADTGGKAYIFKGDTAEMVGELGSPAHKGGIYALSFNRDGSQVLTVSGDKTAKIWDVSAATCVTEFTLGKTVEDMQVGCLWQNDYILSVSLSGYINYLDRNNPTVPLRVIKGHNKPITGLTISTDKLTAYTGSSEGKMYSWNLNTYEPQLISGKGHTNQVTDMVYHDGEVISCGMDDSVVFSSASDDTINDKVSMPSQPRALSVSSDGLVAVACLQNVVLLRDHNIVFSEKFDGELTCVSIHPANTHLIVGCGGPSSDINLYTYQIENDTLTNKTEAYQGAADIRYCDLKFSPSGSFLAICDDKKNVTLLDSENYKRIDYGVHNARVTCCAWSSSSEHLVSGALDSNMMVWPTQKMMQTQVKILGAHKTSIPNKVCWIDDNRLISVGHDSMLKSWTISY